MKNPLEEKRDSIKELKTKLQQNILDEDAAQRTYSEQQRLAQKARNAAVRQQIPEYPFPAVEQILKDIAIQEFKHAETFRRIIKDIEQEESTITTQIDSERRKKEDEDRRKREEEQRRVSGRDTRRTAPLSEGYHGPYRMRR